MTEQSSPLLHHIGAWVAEKNFPALARQNLLILKIQHTINTKPKKGTKMASRKIDDLALPLQKLCLDHIHNCKQLGIDLLITCTYRSGEEQDALYAQGRTTPGHIVTKAKAGQSKHNISINGKPSALAYDVVPLRNGKPVWGTKGDGIDNDPTDDDKDDLELWQRIGAIGEALGLKWAGRWKKFKEYPHFEMQ
jgi:peptidoglycan L-alanyl-D-glutamate endopeptidase CwlK